MNAAAHGCIYALAYMYTQGYVSKRGKLNTAFKKRFFVLDDHYLRYYEDKRGLLPLFLSVLLLPLFLIPLLAD